MKIEAVAEIDAGGLKRVIGYVDVPAGLSREQAVEWAATETKRLADRGLATSVRVLPEYEGPLAVDRVEYLAGQVLGLNSSDLNELVWRVALGLSVVGLRELGVSVLDVARAYDSAVVEAQIRVQNMAGGCGCGSGGHGEGCSGEVGA